MYEIQFEIRAVLFYFVSAMVYRWTIAQLSA